MIPTFAKSAFRAISIVFVIVLTLSGSAQAAMVYGFEFTGGAGAGTDLTWTSDHFFVEMSEDLSTPDVKDVLFKFTNEMPEDPLARFDPSVARLYFDTGKGQYTDLFSSMSIVEQSPGVNLVKYANPRNHPFLPDDFDPDFKFGLSSRPPYLSQDVWGINPGEHAIVKSELGTDWTFSDVILAMSDGMEQGTADMGLRIGIFTYHLLGDERDDGAHVTSDLVAVSAVPLPAAWPMMLAGLGLIGYMTRRRTT